MQFATITILIFVVSSRLVALAAAKPVPNCQASGIAIPLTKYSSFLNSNKSTDLNAITSRATLVREKILSGLDNYKMNTGTMHPFAIKRSDSESRLRRRGASVPLTTYQNKMWLAEISIGTPPQNLKVHIDTGSADTWMLQTGCDGISANRNLWDPHSSTSAQKQTQSFQLAYEDGSSVQGDQYVDKVTISQFTADPQIFGSATSYKSSHTYEYPADGLLGLAFPSISKFGSDTFFASLVQQNRMINPTFSLKLSSSGAEMYIGGANSMLYSGYITYTEVTHPGLWQVSMDNILVNRDPIFANIPAIFDTGSDHIVGNWDHVSELYSRVGGTVVEHADFGLYYLRCDSFPTVSFTFGGRAFEIPPEALRLPPIEGAPVYCFSALMAQRSIELWYIGLPFLQGVYSVFDYGTSKVGFADLA